jgi:hypothetical protein
MTTNQQEGQRQVLFWYFAGFCILTVVLLSPDAGYLNGESFFTVARASPWRKWGDWPAAWCSLKVIFLNVGFFLVLLALGEFLRLCAQKTLGKILLLMTFAPIAGFWIGLYYFVKAIF